MSLKTGSFYEFGEFRLEPAEQLLTRQGRALPLPPKAFELLVLLVENGGRLLSKDQIMQTVWPGSVVEEANLTVTISMIRKALGDRESGSQHIETVPKKGYRFVSPVRGGCGVTPSHGGDKSIALLGNGLDVLWTALPVPERLSDHRDRDRQVRLLHDAP